MREILFRKITPFLLLAIFALVVWVPMGLWALGQDAFEVLSGTLLLFQAGMVILLGVVDRFLVRVVDYRWLVGLEILAIGLFFLNRLYEDRALYIQPAGPVEYFVLVGADCPQYSVPLRRKGIFNRQVALSDEDPFLLIDAQTLADFQVQATSLGWELTYMSGIRDTLYGAEFSVDIYRPTDALEEGKEEELLQSARNLLSRSGCIE